MKTLSAALVLLVGALVCPSLWDNEGVRAAQVGGVIVEKIQDLHLTDQQEAKIADIVKDYRPKVQQAAKDLAALVKDEVDKIGAVLTPEQKQKLQAMKEERAEHREECLSHAIAHLKDLDLTDAEMTKIGEIRKEYRPRIAKVMEGLGGILTDAQKKTRQEALNAGKSRREILEGLKLTDQQKEKVQTVGKEAAGLVREEMEKIRDVLTEEQKAQLQELKDERRERVRDRMAHAITNLKDLNLTDEQRMKIADIRRAYRPKVHEAGNMLRGLVRDEVAQIVAVIKG
jgi:Spy/CpxP family protein refolding chaperone